MQTTYSLPKRQNQNYRIRYSTFFIFVMTMLYFAIVLFLGQSISEMSGSDAVTVSRLAEAGSFEDGGSYAATAFIYSLFPAPLRMPFVYLTGVIYIAFALRIANDRYSLAIISFILVIPSVTAIGTFQKDLLLVWFVIPVAFIFRSNFTFRNSVIAYILIYGLYAYSFREYFFLIMIVTFAFYIFFSSNWKFRLIAILIAISVFILIPTEILFKLQSPRDTSNFLRLIRGLAGTRTAFMNPYPIDGTWHFVLNYLNAFWMLDLSLLSRGFSIRELFLSLNLIVYIFAMYRGLVDKDQKIRFLGAMIAGHFFLIHVFEPDSGSYIRHLSASLLYVSIIISNFFYKKRLQSYRIMQSKQNAAAAM